MWLVREQTTLLYFHLMVNTANKSWPKVMGWMNRIHYVSTLTVASSWYVTIKVQHLFSLWSKCNQCYWTLRYQCWQRTSTTYCSIGVKVAYIVVNIWQWCRCELILLIKLRFSSPGKGNLSRLWLSCSDPFALLLPKL